MDDYADAAQWHYQCASVLHGQSYAAGASHGYGIAAECVLKALMSDLQPQAVKVSGKHLGDSLWREFENHQTLQAHALRVNAAKASKDQFNGWDIKHRYLNQASSCFVPQRLQHQQDGARQLMGLLQLVERGLA